MFFRVDISSDVWFLLVVSNSDNFVSNAFCKAMIRKASITNNTTTEDVLGKHSKHLYNGTAQEYHQRET